jgi:hypothetical protein
MIKTKHTIIINGRQYDAATGLALEQKIKKETTPQQRPATKPKVVISDIVPPKQPSHKPAAIPAPVPHKTRVAAPHAKSKVQRSLTLRRSILKRPALAHRPVAQKVHKKVERSHRISRYSSLTSAPQPPKGKSAVDPELALQAKQLRAKHAAQLKKQAEAQSKPVISSRTIKEHLLKQQLEKAPLLPHPEVYQAGRMSARARFVSVASTSLALVLLGGYLTYINIPNLSIRVAAANAGIDASLPKYQPPGYRIHGPIAYTDGEVSVDYWQDSGRQNYRITQKASDWDPQATLDNYVEPESKGDYQIHSSQGLTVYTYSNKAVWVNGGILHIINGSAPLTGRDVEQIAVSM